MAIIVCMGRCRGTKLCPDLWKCRERLLCNGADRAIPIAAESRTGQIDGSELLHAGTVAPRNRRGISNCRGDSE